MKLNYVASLALSIAPLAYGDPVAEYIAPDIEATNPIHERDDAPFKGKDLTILPLGASITNGHGSSDQNGYRLDLLNSIQDGNTVKYIGSLKTGNMKNNENEGHGGKLISDMEGFAKASLEKKPNVVLIFVGTNDMEFPSDKLPADKAPERMGKLIDDILKANQNAAVLVAQITSVGDTKVQGRIDTYNKGIASVVEEKAKDKKNHVLAVDMGDAITKADHIGDGIHPNDAGYKKIAAKWVEGLQQADKNGWLG
ncbi:MAG: hypothetical protein M1812_001628 [Candelaria pacifica]|nr:MAG: hypothetical protein M1812_001628 [Candelaria pacifica]